MYLYNRRDWGKDVKWQDDKWVIFYQGILTEKIAHIDQTWSTADKCWIVHPEQDCGLTAASAGMNTTYEGFNFPIIFVHFMNAIFTGNKICIYSGPGG